jgi:hypothetical protein
MPLAPCLYNTPSIRWYILDLRAMRSISALSSDIGWLFRYALIGLIQSISDCYSAPSIITISVSLNISTALTEGLINFSIMMSGGVGALEEAIYARWSASRLSRCGTYRTSKSLKNFSILRTSARYSVILSLLQPYSFCTYFATSWESPQMRSRRMPSSLARRSPVTIPSYYAVLLVVGNSIWIAYFSILPSGRMSTTPAPAPFRVYYPSKYITQWSGKSSMPRKPESVHSAIKFVSVWYLIVRRGMNSISYWPIYIAHCAIRLVASLLWSTQASGRSDMTQTVCARK